MHVSLCISGFALAIVYQSLSAFIVSGFELRDAQSPGPKPSFPPYATGLASAELPDKTPPVVNPGNEFSTAFGSVDFDGDRPRRE